MVALGLGMRGLLSAVMRFGPDPVIYALAALIVAPIVVVAFVKKWVTFRFSDRREWLALLVIAVVITPAVYFGVLWWIEEKATQELRNHQPASLHDFFYHPGDAAVLWGAEKYVVNKSSYVDHFVPAKSKVSITAYGGVVKIKLKSHSCQSVIGQVKECSFPDEGFLTLESKTAGTEAYLKFVEDARANTTQ